MEEPQEHIREDRTDITEKNGKIMEQSFFSGNFSSAMFDYR